MNASKRRNIDRPPETREAFSFRARKARLIWVNERSREAWNRASGTRPMQHTRRTLLAALLVGPLATVCRAAQSPRVQQARPLMGTVVEIAAEGADAAVLGKAVDAAFREMQWLTGMRSHYDPRG